MALKDVKITLAVDGSGNVTGAIDNVTSAVDKLGNKTKTTSSIMESSWAKMTAAFAGGNLISMAVEKVIEKLQQLQQKISDSAKYAARVETLGVAMNAVGNNAGYTAGQMAVFEKSVKQMGITTEAARSSLTVMAGANMDLAKSSQLARVAQDDAVIGGINSSEAFSRMIQGIRSGETEMMRNLGIQVNFEAAYRKSALALGKTSNELTEQEKVIARTNAALEYGTMIQGAYEASMTTTGKKLTSMTRWYDELKLAFGEAFSPALGVLVDATTDRLKALLGWATENKAALAEFAKNLADIVAMAAHPLKGLGSFISAPWKGNAYDESGAAADQAASNRLDAAETKKIKLLAEAKRIAAADAYKYQTALDDKAAAAKIKAAKEMEKYLQHTTDSPGFMNWKREQEMLKVEAEYIKQLAKEQEQASKEGGEVRLQMERAEIALLAEESAYIVQFLKDKKTGIQLQQAALEDQLAAVNALEAAYKLSPDDASLQRITIFQQQLDLMNKLGETGPEALRKIRTEYQNIAAEQKKIYDRTAMGGMTNALEEYGRTASDVGAQVKNAFTGAFKSLEDSFTRFLTTGKLSLKSFFDSIKQSLAQMASQKIMLSIGTSLGSSLFGSAASAAGGILGSAGSGATSGLFGAGGALAGVGAMGTSLGAGLTAGFTGVSAASTTAATAASGLYGAGATIGGIASAVAPFALAAAGAYIVGKFGFGIGNKWQTTGSGVSLGIENGDITGQNYLDRKKKGGLFTKNKYSTDYSAVDDQFAEYLTDSFDAVKKTIYAQSATLGIDISKSALEGFSSATQKISLAGKDAKGQQEALAAYFRGISNEAIKMLVPDIDQLTRLGEDYTAAYERMNALKLQNNQLLMQELQLQGKGGGAEYMALLNTQREAEILGMEDSTAAIKRRIWALEDAANVDNEAARAAEQAAATAQATLERNLGLQQQLDLMTGKITQREIDRIGITDATTLSLMDQINAQEDLKTAADEAATALQKQTDAIQKLVSDATDMLRRSIDSELKTLQTRADITAKAYSEAEAMLDRSYTAILDGLTKNLDEANKAASALESTFNMLKSAREGMSLDGSSSGSMASAQANLASVLSAARGGDTSGIAGLGATIGIVTKLQASDYTNSTEYQRAFWQTSSSLQELETITGKQLTDAQQQVASLNTLIEATKTELNDIKSIANNTLPLSEARSNYLTAKQADIAAQLELTTQTSWLNRQYDMLTNINSSVLSVQAAIGNLQAATAVQSAPAAAQTAGLSAITAGFNLSSNSAIGEAVANASTTGMGFAFDQIGKHVWEQVNYNGTAYTITGSEEAGGLAVLTDIYGNRIKAPTRDLKSFAIGTNYVPYDMTARIHEGERIIPKADNYKLTQGNEALIAEVRMLREELRAQNTETAKNTQRTAKILDKWDGDGMPAVAA
jgi:lambda family phage tail tape measure protein